MPLGCAGFAVAPQSINYTHHAGAVPPLDVGQVAVRGDHKLSITVQVEGSKQQLGVQVERRPNLALVAVNCSEAVVGAHLEAKATSTHIELVRCLRFDSLTALIV